MTVNATNSSNATLAESCPTSLDYRSELLYGGSGQKIALLSCAAACTALTFIIYTGTTICIAKIGSRWTKRGDAFMTLSVYPILSLASMVAVLLPTCAIICDAIIITYLCAVLWNFKHSTLKFFGGKQRMIEELSGHPVTVRALPCCCCLFCIPAQPASEKLFFLIRAAILQFFVIRPATSALASILWTHNLYDTGSVTSRGSFVYINVLNILSTLIALYGFNLLRNATSDHLSLTLARAKFILLQGVVVFTNVQSIVFTVLTAAGVIQCSQYLPARDRANELHHVVLNIELLLAGAAASFVYWKALNRETGAYREYTNDRELSDAPPYSEGRKSIASSVLPPFPSQKCSQAREGEKYSEGRASVESNCARNIPAGVHRSID